MDITLQNVSKSFGDKQVLEGFSHTFPQGELTCVMGPSGCGKTTLLSLLLGLEAPDSGEIRLNGQPLQLCKLRDGIKLQFQYHKSYLLYGLFKV